MNFLAAHDCTVDFREFRSLPGDGPVRHEPARPPFETNELPPTKARAAQDPS
jgi:hypothetical protein